MQSKTGWRTTPAPLLIAFGVWIAYMLVRVVIMHTVKFEHGFSPKLVLTGEGIGFACTLLMVLGTTELMNRAVGTQRTMLKVAAIGAGLALALDVGFGFIQFTKSPWEHQWAYKAYSYAAFAAWGMFTIGLALAVPAAKRAIGFVAVGLTLLLWLPMPISDKLWAAAGLEGKTLYTVEMLLRVVETALVGLTAIFASSGETTPQPMSAADGLRGAARGLWLRVIAAVVVVLFTLMMIGSKGGQGAVSFLKLIMMAQAVVGVIALLMTGLGALRAARAGMPDLQPHTLALGGGMSLWAAGVSLAQLPYVYKALYGSGSGFGGGDFEQRFMTALSVALPIVVIVGVGLLATALSGYAARRGNEDLRFDAQGKGIGYVVLMLVAIALQAWMLPKATSIGNFAMLSLLAAGASLWGTIIMAKLLGRGAEALDHAPGLPPASVINDPPRA